MQPTLLLLTEAVIQVSRWLRQQQRAFLEVGFLHPKRGGGGEEEIYFVSRPWILLFPRQLESVSGAPGGQKEGERGEIETKYYCHAPEINRGVFFFFESGCCLRLSRKVMLLWADWEIPEVLFMSLLFSKYGNGGGSQDRLFFSIWSRIPPDNKFPLISSAANPLTHVVIFP